MALPPLRNLLALRVESPVEQDRMLAILRKDRDFETAWSPTTGWVVAASRVGADDADTPRDPPLICCEGEEQVSLDIPPDRTALATVRRLDGDFTFVQLRPRGAALLVRSCGGLVPLYCHADAGLITTRLAWAARYLRGKVVLDPLVNGIWMTASLVHPDQRTLLQDVSIVPRGHSITLERHKCSAPEPYWTPPFPPSRLSHARFLEHAQRLRALLDQRLRRWLDPSGRNLLFLSGGVDSTLLALATRRQSTPFSALSALPPDPTGRLREASIIRRTLDAAGVPESRRHNFPLGDSIRCPRVRRDMVTHMASPGLQQLPDLLRHESIGVAYGGEFADELFGGGDIRRTDWAAHLTPRRMLLELLRVPGTWRDLRHWRTVRHVLPTTTYPLPRRLPRTVHTELQAEYAEWLDRWQRRFPPDAGAGLDRAMTQDGSLGMNWEVCSALGVRRAFPFLSRELLELAHACHPLELMRAGRSKRLIQQASSDLPAVPGLARRDKGDYPTDRCRADRTPLLPPESTATVLDFSRLCDLSLLERRQLIILAGFAESVQAERAVSRNLTAE